MINTQSHIDLPMSSAIVETVRVSKSGRDQLVTLKRRTGIENWNVLCRWALCVSLAEPSPVRDISIPADGPVEMTWRTFGGANAEVYAALVRDRCRRDGLSADASVVAQQFRLHLHRGIAYLTGNPRLRSASDLIRCVAESNDVA